MRKKMFLSLLPWPEKPDIGVSVVAAHQMEERLVSGWGLQRALKCRVSLSGAS